MGGTGVNAPVDSFSWTDHAPTSWGRKTGDDPNSPGEWAQTTNPTYNDPTNDFTNPTDFTVNGTDNSGLNYIQLNEISSTDNPGDPIPGNDWVELINTASVSINVNGVILSDSDDVLADDHKITLDNTNTEVGNACTAPGTIDTEIPSGEFALVKVDDSSIAGNFGLGSDDAIRLYAPGATQGTSTPIDHNEWTDHPASSYQREDAGLGVWINGFADSQSPLEPNGGC